MGKKKSDGMNGTTVKGRGRGRPKILKLEESEFSSDSENEEPSTEKFNQPEAQKSGNGGVARPPDPSVSSSQVAENPKPSAPTPQPKWGDRAGTDLFRKHE